MLFFSVYVNAASASSTQCLTSLHGRGPRRRVHRGEESLERTRLKFSLQGGKVTALCLQEGEQVWALNIKRALLSMLQTSRMASKQQLEKETDVYGTCTSRTAGLVKTQTVSTLLLLRAQPGSPSGADSLDVGVFTDLQFEDEGAARPGKAQASTPLQASQTVRMLCSLTSDPQLVAQEFLQLVFQLRDLTLSQLKTLWQEASFKCRNDWQPLLDALPACGSENCILLLTDLMRSKELEEEQAYAFLTTIALIPHPSPQIINSINSFIPLLKHFMLGHSAPLELRLAAIQAFRRFPCSADRSVLLQLYRSSQEDPEVRIAAYQQLMRCPDQDVFEVVKTTLRSETSSQVGSYVWSHLTNVLRSEDPVKQSLIESLPDDIISRDFEAEFLKYSSYF
ncbi:hypothetical protein D5F01_LYC10755 [Larimichthys crocea]|uniref:Vitellogenin domain-containing protein n=1 Tax=Larimichthys crocea TaxID=215358 RepID=A0A6G0IIS7_LARCR|nr:hypothetical protein D5F01_LYC10755 [Larimichthys crocea]